MATALHINGPPVTLRHFEVEQGQPLRDVAGRWGLTLRTEQVNAPTFGLSAEAAEFIRNYKREDPQSVLAVYWRHHFLGAEEFDTVEQARRFLESSQEDGYLAGEAIVEGERVEVLR